MMIARPDTQQPYHSAYIEKRDLKGSGLVLRLDNLVKGMPNRAERAKASVAESDSPLSLYETQLQTPFQQSADLAQAEEGLAPLQTRLERDADGHWREPGVDYDPAAPAPITERETPHSASPHPAAPEPSSVATVEVEPAPMPAVPSRVLVEVYVEPLPEPALVEFMEVVEIDGTASTPRESRKTAPENVPTAPDEETSPHVEEPAEAPAAVVAVEESVVDEAGPSMTLDGLDTWIGGMWRLAPKDGEVSKRLLDAAEMVEHGRTAEAEAIVDELTEKAQDTPLGRERERQVPGYPTPSPAVDVESVAVESTRGDGDT